MNERFYELPKEKQQKIINAGFRVFSQNTYKKSPMSEIAAAAEISKSLLFHYFKNKKELYLFLWNEGVKMTLEYLRHFGCYESDTLFGMLEQGMKAKLQIMRLYPDMTAFIIKAYYEKEEAIRSEIQKSYQEYVGSNAYTALIRLNPEEFLPGIDLQMMYQNMYYAVEGYLWEAVQRNTLQVDQLEKDFQKMMDFWKSVYCPKSEKERPTK